MATGSRSSKDSATSNMNSKFNISCLTVLIAMCSGTIQSLVVETTNGPVRGKLVRKENVTYYAYQGIPYAEPPTGELRFKPPVIKQSWTDVLKATRDGPVCPQAEGNYRREQMSEDCLYLNIYVPIKKTQTALPALAYVHGGEFKSLSGSEDVIYGPQLVLERDVIFITINYRLGALGFLSLDTEDASGNTGIKDVQLALNWINNNIERFGGSRQQITLGGNSAGSALAHFLLLSEKSKDLFQRAILISGSALGYRFLVRHPKKNAIALAKQLGIMDNNTEIILKKLKNVDAFDIVKAQQSMGNGDERGGFRPFAPFVPSIEIEYPDATIIREPLDIIKDGIPVNVPIIVGFNAQEGLKMLPAILKNYRLINELNENFERCIPSNIQYPIGSEASIQLAKSIQRFYFNDKNITNETLPNFIDLITDTQFSYSIDSWIKYHKERSDSNTLYYYVFDFDGQLNFAKISNNISAPGTSHADELGYLFVTRVTRARLRQLDQRSLRMLNIWMSVTSNFIKYGNPTSGCDFSWMTVNENSRNHLHLDADPNSICNAPIQERLSFWYDVYDKYYEYVRSGGPLEDKNIP